jgi:hypothetical protein
MKIAFGYRMGVGKDTAVNYLIQKHGGTRVSFAGPIYDILAYAQKRCGFTPHKDRQFLQYIGAEWGRRQDPDIWVKLALEASAETQGNVFISDLRFPNEFEALKRDGWICVKLIRTDPEDRVGTGTATHISETALDGVPDEEWDYVIANDGTLEEFEAKIKQIYDSVSLSHE